MTDTTLERSVWDLPSLLQLLALERYVPVIFDVNADATDVRCSIDCSDLFHWACSDSESVAPCDLPDLIDAFQTMKTLDAPYWTGELFVCRRRRMRPKGPWYGYCDTDGKVRRRFVPIAVQSVFDACGPERPDSPPPPRPADGRRWDYGGAVEPDGFADLFAPGGTFGP